MAEKTYILVSFLKVLFRDPAFAASYMKNASLLISLRLKGKLRVIALTEHLGDIVAAEPVARFIQETEKDPYVCWVCDKKYKEVFSSHPAIKKVITVTCLTEWIALKKLLPATEIIDLHINNKVCSRHGFINTKANPFNITYENYFEKGNLLYCYSRAAGIELDSTAAPKLFFNTKFPDPFLQTKYIVLHTSSNNPEKEWTAENWDKLTSHLLKDPRISIVEIGIKKNIRIEDKRIYDYTGNKELGAIYSIIGQCILFIGLDSAFAHFANSMNKDGIVLQGIVGSFCCYNPFSGKYMEDAIIQFNGMLADMPFENVKDTVNTKLKTVTTA